MRQHFVKKDESPTKPVLQQGVTNMQSPKEMICKPTLVEPWRIFRIMAEFVDGFEVLQKYGLAATIFGKTRATPEDREYKMAEDLAARLAKQGFTIITGGASGIMEAANKGAFEAGGQSVGLNIRLPVTQHNNHYLTDAQFFNHFYVRKVMLSFASEVYIFFPGGFGTLDEFFEILTLVQTKKIKQIPIIMVGKEYWSPLVSFFETTLYTRFNAIKKEDMELYYVVDSVEEAYALAVSMARC